MTFSFFLVKHVPVYTVANANLAWIMQDYLLAHRIDASIEVEPCKGDSKMCSANPSYSVCVPSDKAEQAKELADKCEAVKIAGFLGKHVM